MSNSGNRLDVTNALHSTASAGIRRWAAILAGAVVVCSALHFWPWEGRRLWEVLAPTNVIMLIWILSAGLWCIANRQWTFARAIAPPVSLMAYICVVILSVAFAPDSSRAAFYAGKLVLTIGGGYTLFVCATLSATGRRMVYGLFCLAVTTAVIGCLAARFIGSGESFGFFRSPLKYGTYLGMLVPLCAVWLMLARSWGVKLMGGGLVIAAVLSAGTVGCVLAIGAGLVAAALAAPRRSWRLGFLGVLIAAILSVALWPGGWTGPLRRDAALRETGGTHARQRYIQWQAFLNLLEDRTVTGTGAGCVNEYRSAYYGRLPKLNTLAPFDENGYLAAADEGGVFALACLGWIIVQHVSAAWRRVRRASWRGDRRELRESLSAWAAMVGACLANVFSAVQFNGILIVFMAVLALAAAGSDSEEVAGGH